MLEEEEDVNFNEQYPKIDSSFAYKNPSIKERTEMYLQNILSKTPKPPTPRHYRSINEDILYNEKVSSNPLFDDEEEEAKQKFRDNINKYKKKEDEDDEDISYY